MKVVVENRIVPFPSEQSVKLTIQKEYENLTESVDTLSRHITNSYNTMNHVQTKTVKLGQQIKTTSFSGIEEEKLIEEVNSDPILPVK